MNLQQRSDAVIGRSLLHISVKDCGGKRMHCATGVAAARFPVTQMVDIELRPMSAVASRLPLLLDAVRAYRFA